jgi:hypothetical protein
MTRGREGKEKK